MISLNSTTDRHYLQPSLADLHNKSLECLSAIVRWKRELHILQKFLDRYSSKFPALEDKKRLDHFQNLMIYYSGELVPEINRKIRLHEGDLARLIREKNGRITKYITEHRELMEQVASFSKNYDEYRHDLYEFIERVM